MMGQRQRQMMEARGVVEVQGSERGQWRDRKTALQVEGRCSGSETAVKPVNKTRVGRVEVRKEWDEGASYDSYSVWKATAKRGTYSVQGRSSWGHGE